MSNLYLQHKLSLKKVIKHIITIALINIIIHSIIINDAIVNGKDLLHQIYINSIFYIIILTVIGLLIGAIISLFKYSSYSYLDKFYFYSSIVIVTLQYFFGVGSFNRVISYIFTWI